LKKNLSNEHGEEKSSNYIRMLNLIKEKKNYKFSSKKRERSKNE